MKIVKQVLIIFVFLICLIGCTKENNKTNKIFTGKADNEIATFEDNSAGKPIIRVGIQYYIPDSRLQKVLTTEFPEYCFIFDQAASAGSESERIIKEQLEHKYPYDLILGGKQSMFDEKFFVDLSTEEYLNNYLLSVLSRISNDAMIKAIPCSATFSGIMYNKAMFKENGWEVPKSIEEFFSLCKEIKKKGIKPLSTCFKYSGQVKRFIGMVCYSQVQAKPKDILWMQQIEEGLTTDTENMRPYFDFASRLYKEGIVSLDSFSASLTKRRYAFWNGEYAMIDYDSAIYTYIRSEKPGFDLGIMPYPALDGKDACLALEPEYFFSIPYYVQDNPEKFAQVRKILAFISTEKGQKALLEGSLKMSNLKNTDFLSFNDNFPLIKDAYKHGNVYTMPDFTKLNIDIEAIIQKSIKKIFEGESAEAGYSYMQSLLNENSTTVNDQVDNSLQEPIAVAEEDFSILETSYYIADKIKEATNTDIGLTINGGFFRSNLTSLYKGDISNDTRRFTMKGVTSSDCITNYSLTGSNIKALLERPIVNGNEIDVFIAASGLKVEYAPWNKRGERVLMVTLEDGSPLLDDKLYSVSAYTGVIDEKYISKTNQKYTELGAIDVFMRNVLKQDKSIKPNIKKRVKLVWPE